MDVSNLFELVIGIVFLCVFFVEDDEEKDFSYFFLKLFVLFGIIFLLVIFDYLRMI